MKNTTKIVIAVIVAIILAIVVYVMFFDEVKAPQVVVPGQTIPANWVTYSDPKTGINIQAPSGLMSTSTDVGFSLIFATTTPYVHTHLLHELRIDINNFGTDCPAVEDQVSTTTVVVVNGVNFERQNWSGVGAGNLYQGINYTTGVSGSCYRISLYTHSTNGEGFYTNDQVQIKKIDALQVIDIRDLFALFDQIATTVKFTK